MPFARWSAIQVPRSERDKQVGSMYPLYFDVPLEQHNVLVFICSTTGNGDAPSNADRCWRYIKKRSQPKDLMANVNYTVLGHGKMYHPNKPPNNDAPYSWSGEQPVRAPASSQGPLGRVRCCVAASAAPAGLLL